MVPHGSKYSRLIGDQDNDGYGNYMPARYAFDNDVLYMGVTNFKKYFDADHSGRAGGPVFPLHEGHGGETYCYYDCHW